MSNNFFSSKYDTNQNTLIDDLKENFIGNSIISMVPEVINICDSTNGREDFIDKIQNLVITSIDHSLHHAVLNQAEELIGENLNELFKNTVMGTASIMYSFTKSLFQYSIGNIDADQLMSNSFSSVIVSGTSALGASAFSLASGAIGMGASAGTIFGPVGTVIGGALGALIGTGIVFNAKNSGLNRVKRDINSLNNKFEDTQSIYKYIDVVGSMDEFKFSFKNLIPFCGALGCLSEYSARKRALEKIESNLLQHKNELEKKYLNYTNEVNRQYLRAFRHLENEFNIAREKYFSEAKESAGIFIEEVNQFLYLKANSLEIIKTNHKNQFEKLRNANEIVRNQYRETEFINNTIETLFIQTHILTNHEDKELFIKVLDDISSGMLSKIPPLPIKQAETFLR